jgi:NitT/TauT family transport system permease protein
VVALNMHAGFMGVSPTLRMVGRNYGLGSIAYVVKILVPAAFPSILTGLKVGWAFAWRTLIAAELVFGVSSGKGGLGWFIFENKNQLEIPSVFAGLLCVILIGLAMENLVFRWIERRTVRRWGMQN